MWGKLMTAKDSLALGTLPIGLAYGIKLTRAVAARKPLTWADVAAEDNEAMCFCRETEAVFTKETENAAK